MWINPSFLIYTPRRLAERRPGEDYRLQDLTEAQVASLVLRPELFAQEVLFGTGGRNQSRRGALSSANAALDALLLLDICTLGVLGAGLGAGNLSPVLAAGAAVIAVRNVAFYHGTAVAAVVDEYRKNDPGRHGIAAFFVWFSAAVASVVEAPYLACVPDATTALGANALYAATALHLVVGLPLCVAAPFLAADLVEDGRRWWRGEEAPQGPRLGPVTLAALVCAAVAHAYATVAAFGPAGAQRWLGLA